MAKGAGIDDDSEKIRFGRDATLEVRMATGKRWSQMIWSVRKKRLEDKESMDGSDSSKIVADTLVLLFVMIHIWLKMIYVL